MLRSTKIMQWLLGWSSVSGDDVPCPSVESWFNGREPVYVTLSVGLNYLLFTILAMCLIDIIGRAPLLIASYFIMVLGVLLPYTIVAMSVSKLLDDLLKLCVRVWHHFHLKQEFNLNFLLK